MTTLATQSYLLPSADLGPENPLPSFRDPNHSVKPPVDGSVPEEDRRRLGWEVGYRILPHRIQDGYNRDRKPREFRGVVLENENLRATFLPELGGRLVSLFHKPSARELLDRNPVFQPANLAVRNAWFSGGIEWNMSHFGHHFLTCSPVFAARVEAPEGYPVLRLYEWDRVKCFPWQIDFHLPPGSEFLFARVRLVNPHDHEISMYWWTNIAVPEADGVRMLAPAETALHCTAGYPFNLVHLPKWNGVDLTYSTQLLHAQEFFCRIPEDQRRWVAALDRNGTGFVETSTRRMRGRKLWAWGMNEGGRHWQEFLSQPGRAYIEIQAGLARTQLESVPFPAREEWTWTEAFGFLKVDPAKAHSSDWSAALEGVQTALNSRLSECALDELDERFAATTRKAASEIFMRGSGWGALERRRLATSKQPDRIPAELSFDDSSLGDEQQAWLTLLKTGKLPEGNPGAWMVQPEWQGLLESAVRAGHGDHWLSWLHLGVMRMENGDSTGAVEAWKRSLQHERTALSLRNLAIAEQRLGNQDTACRLLGEAWEAGPQLLSLAIELANALSGLGRFGEVDAFVRQLPAAIRQHERIALAAARAALAQGRLTEVEPLFQREFVTIRESEVVTTDLWFEFQARRLAETKHVPLDDDLRQRVRREMRPPIHLDYRMAKDN